MKILQGTSRLWLFAVLAYLPTTVNAQLPAGTGWLALPNTKIRSVCAAENGFPQVWGVEGCPAITDSWSGGTFDSKRNRLIVWGGGHNAYYGNELYAISLNDGTLARITDPGLPIASTCQESIAGGSQPNSRHTYDGIEYMSNVDRLFVFSGSLACQSGNFGNSTWTFDFPTMRWAIMTPAGQAPRGEAGMMTAYDPVSGLVYLHDRLHLYSYDPIANRYTRLSSEYVSLGYHMVATVDPKRQLFVIAGYDSSYNTGSVYTYDIGPNSNYRIRRLATTGGSSLIGNIYPGLDYDPTLDRIVAWGENSRNAVYLLDLDSNTWSVQTFAGGPRPAGRGTHGRWRYSAASGVFVLANHVDDDVRILRLSGAPLSPPNPPTGLQVQ